MQALAGVAREFGQALFDIEMDVFKVNLPDELAACDLFADLRQAIFDRA